MKPHLALPTVCPPESATRSAGSDRALLLKTVRRLSTSVLGPGSMDTSSAPSRLSVRPRGMANIGPPARATASRVATAMMSAQETVGPQAAWTLARMASIRSTAFFCIDWLGPVLSSGSRRIDASQP